MALPGLVRETDDVNEEGGVKDISEDDYIVRLTACRASN